MQANLIDAEKLNGKRTHNSSAWYGVTKFSDFTQQEFQGIVLQLSL